MSVSPVVPPSPSTPRIRRRPSSRRPRAGSQVQITPRDAHRDALHAIRNLLKSKTCYDVLPLSYKVIALDTKLDVKNALNCLVTNGVVSACLWDSDQYRFAGVLTVSDFVHLMAYYYKKSLSYDAASENVESLTLDSLREVEKELGVDPPPSVSVHPDSSLWEAARQLMMTHARRMPLIDKDSAISHELIVSVLTQYRLLRFIAVNCREVSSLHLPLRKLGIGTYVKALPSEPMSPTKFEPIKTATLGDHVFDVVQMFSDKCISAVPIIDKDGVVVNLYETVDIISLVKSGQYNHLDMSVDTALRMRSPQFPGVITCRASDSLGSLLELIAQRRVHRLVVVEGEGEVHSGGKRGRLLGIITLSDILQYLVGGATTAEEMSPMSTGRGDVFVSTPSSLSLESTAP